MATVKEVAYLARNNAIDLKLFEDGQAVDLGGLTKVILKLGAVELDSDSVSGAFDWVTRGAEGILSIFLGCPDNPTIEAGTYYCTLIIFDSINPCGVVWTEPSAKEKLLVTVKEGH